MSRFARSVRPILLVLGLSTVLAGCDDQVKRVPWFKTMFRTESVRTYEAELPTAPEGTVPVGAHRHFDLLAADTLLASPLTRDPDVIERGHVLYLRYCVMCHGDEGKGDGPVVGENRLPPLPTLNLLSDRAKNDLSDGYIWGMIANGRGVMPSYRRVPYEDRWFLVEYVRVLQDGSRVETAAASNDTQTGNE